MHLCDGVFGVITGVLCMLQCVIGVRWGCMYVGVQCGVREDEICCLEREAEAGFARKSCSRVKLAGAGDD